MIELRLDDFWDYVEIAAILFNPKSRPLEEL